MIYARLEIVVAYRPQGQFDTTSEHRLPGGEAGEKLTITNLDNLAAVQVREEDSQTDAFPIAVETTEQRVDVGFQSFIYVTRITGLRFRCTVPGQTTRLAFTVYG